MRVGETTPTTPDTRVHPKPPCGLDATSTAQERQRTSIDGQIQDERSHLLLLLLFDMARSLALAAALVGVASAQLIQSSSKTRVNATGAIAVFMITDCPSCT